MPPKTIVQIAQIVASDAAIKIAFDSAVEFRVRRSFKFRNGIAAIAMSSSARSAVTKSCVSISAARRPPKNAGTTPRDFAISSTIGGMRKTDARCNQIDVPTFITFWDVRKNAQTTNAFIWLALQTGEFDYAWNMLVEDDILVRAQVGRALKGLGYRVSVAGDGPSALIALGDLHEAKALEISRAGLASRNPERLAASARAAGNLVALPGVSADDVRDQLATLLADHGAWQPARLAALNSLLALNDPRLDSALALAVRDAGLESSDLLNKIQEQLRKRKVRLTLP